MFNVKLESFDAGSKPKIIREVKALVPNLTLIDVRPAWSRHILYPAYTRLFTGKEVRRVTTQDVEGELVEGGRREAPEGI